MTNRSFEINGRGRLEIGGADAVQLAETYGTPLYVMDEDGIRRACRSFKDAVTRHYNGNGMVLYASKAFCCKEMYRIADSEGLGADVVSAGELCTARSAGFPAEKIFFHGNNKTEADLRLAAENNVGTIVVDNLTELRLLETLLESMGKVQNVMLRVKPGVDAHTHSFIRTGQIDSKFGFALETGEAMAAVREALAMKQTRLMGIHCHIGSQIFDAEPFGHAADVMAGFLGDIRRECGAALSQLNLGGGYGIRYVDRDDPAPCEAVLEQAARSVKERCAREGIAVPFLLIEPGRSIVGAQGATLYTVGAVKEIPKIRTYVSVDGGMTDNPRYALYQSAYEATIANHADRPKTKRVTIAGCCCESGDLLGEGVAIQECGPGDILAVLCTGAYNYSMASNYNRIPRPAVVMVRGGEARLAVRRESFDDLMRNDL